MVGHGCLHSLLNVYCNLFRLLSKLCPGFVVNLAHTLTAPLHVLPFIGNPQKASFLSAHLSYSILNSLTSQHPPNYSPQVYTGKQCLPLRDSSLEQWTRVWSNHSLPCSYFNSLASCCQQGAAIESFLFGCLQARSSRVAALDSGEHMLQ